MIHAPLLKLAAMGVLTLGLSGCISVLPKTEPSRLYRFGAPPASEAPARAESVGVFRAPGSFQQEAAGDRILTVTGTRAAYIAQTRWVAPAEVLFDAAVTAAFESAPGRVRLVSRRDPARADAAIRLDVRNFETRYGEGPTPVVLVRVRAILVRDRARNEAAEQIFEARIPAQRNRVAAIVAAYDAALAKVLAEIIAWTNEAIA